MKKKINLLNKKSIWLSLILIILGLFGSLYTLKQKVEKVEKDISQLNSIQKTEKERIDNLITFNWQNYFNRDWITFKYPESASLCEEKTDEGLDIKVSFDSDCKELEKITLIPWDLHLESKEKTAYPATITPSEFLDEKGISRPRAISLWDFEIRYIRKDFESTEDLVNYVGLRGAENITTEETKNKFPKMGEKYLTEWYLGEKNGTYAVIKFNPTLSENLKGPNLALVIMARNYGGISLENEPIVNLILKSIQLP